MPPPSLSFWQDLKNNRIKLKLHQNLSNCKLLPFFLTLFYCQSVNYAAARRGRLGSVVGRRSEGSALRPRPAPPTGMMRALFRTAEQEVGPQRHPASTPTLPPQPVPSPPPRCTHSYWWAFCTSLSQWPGDCDRRKSASGGARPGRLYLRRHSFIVSSFIFVCL